MRAPLVVGNWKMNLTEAEGAELARALHAPAGVEAGVAPAFPLLRAVADALPPGIALAAQDVHWEEKGAFTGAVAPGMLAALGVRYVIVGHSERRHVFGERDDETGRKAAAAARHGMVPIVCVGELLAERDAGRTLEVVHRQLDAALAPLEVRTGREVVIAYEPVWAIGTGRTATPGQADEVHRAIRARLGERRGPEVAGSVRVLYGGSVTPQTAPGLFALPDVDGGLVGGASLQAEAFRSILQAAAP